VSEQDSQVIPDGNFEPRSDLDAVEKRAWLVGGVGAVLIAAGYFTSAPATFFRAYLVGWLFCLSVGLGLFAVLMLNHVSRGDWGVMLRRVSEASGRTLPFFLLAAVPLAFGLEHLYPWVAPERDASGHIVDHLLAHKHAYLNTGFFLARTAIYFVIWTALAFLISSWSRRHDETGDERYREKMKRLSALGLVLYVVTGTLASVDWIMSVDPHWFSSLFGFIFVSGQALSAFAFAVPAMVFLSRRKPFAELVRKKLFHDYGKLLLAMVMFWGYMMISQYLIIWSGDLPEEVTWYLDRSGQGWQVVSLVLVLGHFGLPFLLLLSADLKKKPQLLAWVAYWVLAMRWLDYYWLISPSVSHQAIAFHWLDPVVPVGLGGLWIALLVGQLKNRAVLPVREPGLKEILAHG
jgi:hypothetical protein